MKERKVFTFHDSLPGSNVEHATRLLLLWRQNWEKAGYTPIVLNEHHARQHPAYEQFNARIKELPTINRGSYETACYLRYLAMAVMGGGLMTDADVMVYSDIPERKGDPAKLVSLQGHIPCCVYGNRYAYDQVVKQMLEYQVSEKDIEENSRQPHVSDMYMFYRGGIAYTSKHVVKSYGDEGWEQAPLVHFSNASLKGNGPRFKVIPQLRGF
jgi:hypothetical protein